MNLRDEAQGGGSLLVRALWWLHVWCNKEMKIDHSSCASLLKLVVVVDEVASSVFEMNVQGRDIPVLLALHRLLKPRPILHEYEDVVVWSSLSGPTLFVFLSRTSIMFSNNETSNGYLILHRKGASRSMRLVQ